MLCNRLQISAQKRPAFMPIPVRWRVWRFDAIIGQTLAGVGIEERRVKTGTVRVAPDISKLSMPKLEEQNTALAKYSKGIDLRTAALTKAPGQEEA